MGTFQVLKKNDKFVIVYVEKGVAEYLDTYNFDGYYKAADYLESHKDELIKVIEEKKAEEKRKEEERIAREKEAAEKKKKEEEERQAEKEAKEKKKQEKKEARKKFWSNWKKFFAGILAGVMLLVSGHFIGVLFSNLFGKKDDGKIQDPTSSTIESTEPTHGIDEAIDEIKEKDKALSQEEFEKLVDEFSKKYTDNSIDLTIEDLVKFVSIINIDELLEENPEFVSELFGTQTFEAYMDDAMDAFAATYGYNYMTHAKEGKTDNFIWLSDCVYGSQKDKMLIVENYVKLIANANGNKEEVNKLVTELLGRIASGDLTNLDSGVRFGMNVYLVLIRSYLAKNELTKENFDELTTVVEMNLNNIMTEYKECNVSKQTSGVSTTVKNDSLHRPVKNPYKGVARVRTMQQNYGSFNHRTNRRNI